MFGIGHEKGFLLPQLTSNKEVTDDGSLAINGTKTHQVKPYSHNRTFMLPHISQKSPRLPPKHVYNVYSINQTQGSMLEAIEIYKRRNRASYSPEREKRHTGAVIFQSVPCPTPAERIITTVSEEEAPLPPLQAEVVEDKPEKSEATFVRQPTKLLPVTISLQRKLEKLAKHKCNTHKKQPFKDATKAELTVRNSKESVGVPRFRGEHTTHHLHYTFNSKLLPKLPKYSHSTKISCQLLEIPSKLSKANQKSMFSHPDYDMFQHTKFSNPIDKKLSIVEGPRSQMDAVWDYNKFLYLNVKI